MQNSYFLNSECVSVVVDGTPYNVSKDHPSFDQVVSCIVNEDWDTIPGLMNPIQLVTDRLGNLEGSGLTIDLDEMVAHYGDDEIRGRAVEVIVELLKLNLPVDRYIRFLERLQANPSMRSREQAFRFVEENRVTIDEDGDLVLYKWVQDNYRDCHTGTFDNSVGSTLKMDRSKVDDDPQRTCSAGLHVCSSGYSRFGARLMLAKVNPANIVSVPIDYKNSKLRVCEYTIIAEVEEEYDPYGSHEERPYYGTDGDEYEETDIQGIRSIEIDGGTVYAYQDSTDEWFFFGVSGYTLSQPWNSGSSDWNNAVEGCRSEFVYDVDYDEYDEYDH